MFRTIVHLLPRALAWSTTVPAKALRKYFEGLAAFAAEVRTFIDLVLLDVLPETTRELVAWEKQFGLNGGGSDDERRAKLAIAWTLQGGQSPDYIQGVLHAAGFTTVFVHEWWDASLATPPYVARDPRDYIAQPLIGLYQCEATSPWECFDPAPLEPLAPHCDDTLVNDPGYIVNLDLTRRAPPPVPDDPAFWPYFIYLGAETFPDPAPVPASRLAELKELILQIRPTHNWIVLIVDAVDELDGGFGSGAFGAAPFGA
jgi:hypothetical protein